MNLYTATILIHSFYADAPKDGTPVWLKLPRNHRLFIENKALQIRNTRALAEYRDELGNTVRLCNDGIIRQYTPEELKALGS